MLTFLLRRHYRMTMFHYNYPQKPVTFFNLVWYQNLFDESIKRAIFYFDNVA